MLKPEITAVQVKITLKGTDPCVWRVVHFLANSSLRILHQAICDLMGWDGFELGVFEVGDDIYTEMTARAESEGWLDESKMSLKRICSAGHSVKFIYGESLSWFVCIDFEDIFPADSQQRYPICVRGANSAPPRGCSSPSEFASLQKQITVNKKKPKHWFDREIVNNRPESFDPTYFDPRFVNEVRLMRRKVAKRK